MTEPRAAGNRDDTRARIEQLRARQPTSDRRRHPASRARTNAAALGVSTMLGLVGVMGFAHHANAAAPVPRPTVPVPAPLATLPTPATTPPETTPPETTPPETAAPETAPPRTAPPLPTPTTPRVRVIVPSPTTPTTRTHGSN